MKVAADYSQLGELLVTQMIVVLVLPFAAIFIVRLARMRTA